MLKIEVVKPKRTMVTVDQLKSGEYAVTELGLIIQRCGLAFVLLWSNASETPRSVALTDPAINSRIWYATDATLKLVVK